jgi:hypothetical protein
MTALPFFTPPLHKTHHLANGLQCHEVEVPLPETYHGFASHLRFSGPLTWHGFDRVRPTISQNAIVELIVDAARQARILHSLIAGLSLTFSQSFDIMFPGQSATTTCEEHPVKSWPEIEQRLCDGLARLGVNSTAPPTTSEPHHLVLDWTGLHDRVTRAFARLKGECLVSLANLRYFMRHGQLVRYADGNAVFREWWAERTREVDRIEEILHDAGGAMVVVPTVCNVLVEISRQVPPGQRVKVVMWIDGCCRDVCEVVAHAVLQADRGRMLAEIERRSCENEVSLLFEGLGLHAE